MVSRILVHTTSPRRRRHASLALTVAAALSAIAVADDWSTAVGKNSARYGLSAETGPTDPLILWQGGRSAIVSQQGVAAGGLFVLPRIQSFTIPIGSWIVAHDLSTGVERWAVQLPFNDPNEWRNKVMAIRDGRVYATRSGGEVNPAALYALDPADGSILWQSQDLIEERTTESPAFAADGDLIIGNFRSLMRINADDGLTVWQVPRSCPSSNGCQAAVFAGRAYVFEPSGSGPIITAFDVSSGARLYSSAAVAGGLVQQLGLFVGPDGTVYAPRTQNNPATDFFVAYEDTGSALLEKWRIPMGYVPFASHAVGPDGSVYAYRTIRNGSVADLIVLRLDPADGSIINQSQPILTDFPAGPRIAIDAGGKVFLTNGGFANGGLFAFDADLTLRWSEPLFRVNLGGPVIAEGGILLVNGVGGDIRAYFTEPAAPCVGDLDNDGDTDLADLGLLLADFGCAPPGVCVGDLNGDGFTDLADLGILLADFGCTP